MDKLGPTLIIIAIVIVVFAAMWWGWHRRSRRDSGLHADRTMPAALGAEHTSFDAFYVATTAHERPLNRLAVTGLGFRARATVGVFDAGIVLNLSGEQPVFIAASRIDSVDRATATIDRVVEHGGLVRLAWRIAGEPDDGPVTVDSYLRPIAPEAATAFIQAVGAIVSEGTPTAQDQRKRGAA